MAVQRFAESVVEEAALSWLAALGFVVKPGIEIAPSGIAAERASYGDVVLESRLMIALAQLNPDVPPDAIDEAFRKLMNVDGASLIGRNRNLHRMLTEGVAVEYRRSDGTIKGSQVRVLDFEIPENNDWIAINQFTVVEDKRERRVDIVIFVNGLPLAIVELKNAADEGATIGAAFNQLQTYKRDIPSLFLYNVALVISDGTLARIGSLTADRERFMPWRTITGEALAPATVPELQVVLQGVFEQRRFLDLIRHFVVFEFMGGSTFEKKIAAYHQFHAVNTALQETLRATQLEISGSASALVGEYSSRHVGGAVGDRRVGVVWHTQGSGKSLTMAFYAGRIILSPAMENPTLVVLTDRNDLDEQLFQTFVRCSDLLRQSPSRAESRADLRDKLRAAAGGVVFTTIQKFFAADDNSQSRILSDRRNIVVIADEAHRSQYDFIDGFARHMRDALPHASFIGFTGTPIESADSSTRAVFGNYISIYDIRRAVEDGATVPIYYEGRLAKLNLIEAEKPRIDPDFEEITEGEEIERKEKLKSKWAQLEAIVGADKRIRSVAEDLVDHFEQRLDAMEGKAMVVCMSRRICVDLYDAIIRVRPAWHREEDAHGAIKVVMTGSADDPVEWQSHIRNKKRREDIAKRLRDSNDGLKLVIVRDMWLTGFDAPCLHTMYIDKPMRGHGLMQAIARVNRVFRDKPGGLVVDYLGLAEQLRRALVTYTEAGGTGLGVIDQELAILTLQEKYEVCCSLFHGFDWTLWKTGLPTERLGLLPAAQEHILAQVHGKDRLLKVVSELSRAFALAVPSDAALTIRDDVSFFQAVRAALVKSPSGAKIDEDLDHAVRQIVSRAVSSDDVIDLFAAAGLQKPNIAILSDRFLADVRGLPQKNLAIDMLSKLLINEIRERADRNVIQARSFAALLEQVIARYRNRSIDAATVVEELIQIARDLRSAGARGEKLGLSDDELAFYDALEVSDSAVAVLGDAELRTIARELVESVRSNVSVDWTVRENVRAKLRVLVKRILKRHGYPPDKQEKATDTVIEQAEVLSRQWAAA